MTRLPRLSSRRFSQSGFALEAEPWVTQLGCTCLSGSGCVTERTLLVRGWIGARVDTRALLCRALRSKAAQSPPPVRHPIQTLLHPVCLQRVCLQCLRNPLEQQITLRGPTPVFYGEWAHVHFCAPFSRPFSEQPYPSTRVPPCGAALPCVGTCSVHECTAAAMRTLPACLW